MKKVFFKVIKFDEYLPKTSLLDRVGIRIDTPSHNTTMARFLRAVSPETNSQNARMRELSLGGTQYEKN